MGRLLLFISGLNMMPWWTALAVASVIAGIAWRLGHLRASGAVAAAIVGMLALRANAAWALYLITWFALASLASRFEHVRKARVARHLIAKIEARDAWQVLANGGLFASLALVTIVRHDSASMVVCLSVAAAAALAAAGADTFATEIGMLQRTLPLSVRTWTRVPIGTSGAVTALGMMASVVGSSVLAIVALTVGMIPREHILTVAAAGVAGSAFDTIIGAWIQESRWCQRCATETEQHLHDCGTATIHRRGTTHVNNDVVNALCTVGGATVALLMAC